MNYFCLNFVSCSMPRPNTLIQVLCSLQEWIGLHIENSQSNKKERTLRMGQEREKIQICPTRFHLNIVTA